MVEMGICKQTEAKKKQTKMGPVRLFGWRLISNGSVDTIFVQERKIILVKNGCTVIVSRVKFLKGWNLSEAPTLQTATVRPSNVTITVSRGGKVNRTSGFTKLTPRS